MTGAGGNHGSAKLGAPVPAKPTSDTAHAVRALLLRVLPVCALLTACQGDHVGDASSRAPGQQAPASTIHLVDATEASGIHWVHRSAASEERFLPETMGAGVALFDADGDGHLDVYLVGGLAVADLGKAPGAVPANAALFLGRGDGTFHDVTDESGLAVAQLGMGVAFGDLDNDGDDDLLVTGVGGDRLFDNRSSPGDPRFVDVSEERGLTFTPGPHDLGFSSSAALFDYDRDGWLDVFIGRYVAWTPEDDLPCLPDGRHRSYCTPEAYPAVPSRLLHNRGGGRFEDVTSRAGVDLRGKAMGVATLDFDDDGWPDLAVANDTARNFLFRNRSDGTFEEVGVELGVAVGPSGAPRGAMGLDTGDLDGDLAQEIVIGNFAQEMSAIYRRTEAGLFVDEAPRWGVGLPTLMPLAFGVASVDLDLDGWLDLVFVHGHIEPEVARLQPLQQHAQPLIVFRNRGGGEGQTAFEQLRAEGELARPLVGRGLATGDLDSDGDLDLVITQNGGPVKVLRNDSPPRHHLRIRLEGTPSNRSAYGAKVQVQLGDRILRRDLDSGASYLSASEATLTFGLGKAKAVGPVFVTWPSGVTMTFETLAIDRTHTIQEPELR